MIRSLVTKMLEALDESRGDVSQCLQEELPKAGYERYDRRIKAITEQLEKHDAAIKAAREYLAAEPKPTLTEALAQQGIKLRTEFEPKQRDSELAAEPSGERAELIKTLKNAAYRTDDAALCDTLEGAADMLEADAQQYLKVGDSRFESWYSELNQASKGSKQIAREAYEAGLNDAQQAKRVPMTDREISEIVNRYYRLMGPAEFAHAIEAHHGITPAEKPTVDEPEEEDLYALALKADNWGQP